MRVVSWRAVPWRAVFLPCFVRGALVHCVDVAPRLPPARATRGVFVCLSVFVRFEHLPVLRGCLKEIFTSRQIYRRLPSMFCDAPWLQRTPDRADTSPRDDAADSLVSSKTLPTRFRNPDHQNGIERTLHIVVCGSVAHREDTRVRGVYVSNHDAVAALANHARSGNESATCSISGGDRKEKDGEEVSGEGNEKAKEKKQERGPSPKGIGPDNGSVVVWTTEIETRAPESIIRIVRVAPSTAHATWVQAIKTYATESASRVFLAVHESRRATKHERMATLEILGAFPTSEMAVVRALVRQGIEHNRRFGDSSAIRSDSYTTLLQLMNAATYQHDDSYARTAVYGIDIGGPIAATIDEG